MFAAIRCWVAWELSLNRKMVQAVKDDYGALAVLILRLANAVRLVFHLLERGPEALKYCVWKKCDVVQNVLHRV